MKPEIIIELAGGLGNQMFQYAFFLQMQHLGYPCKMYYDQAQYIHNGAEVGRMFGLQIPFATKDELDRILDRRKDVLSRVLRKIRGSKPSQYWEHDKGYDFKPEILNQSKPVYLQGCWLSEKYFSDISEEVKTVFQFAAFEEIKNKEMAAQIKDDLHAVSIHIRRGDYLASDRHRNLNYKEYLTHAIAIITERTENMNLYVFSDDTAFAKSVLDEWEMGSIFFVDWNSGKDSFNDMHLMSLCRHNIICNSTFSWWAAWLNEHPGKIIISPKDWFTTKALNGNDIVPERWITV